MKTRIQSATNLPDSPEANRHHRERQYVIAMGIRMICFALVLAVPGLWKIIPAIGVIILPYIAVVLANVGSPHASVAVGVTKRNLALDRGMDEET